MTEQNLCKQFSLLTGASSNEALNWLEMTGFVLQDAIDLYFDSGSSGGNLSNLPPAPCEASAQEVIDFNDDFVRKPDEVVRQKLVDSAAYLGTAPHTNIMSLFINANSLSIMSIETNTTKRITAAFTSGVSRKQQSEKEKTLAVLFQAPLDIMTQTTFEEVRTKCHILLMRMFVNN
jgi:hypothetical protein